MKTEATSLAQLDRHLVAINHDFLAEPRFEQAGVVNVTAVINDLLLNINFEVLSLNEINFFNLKDLKRRNYLVLVLISAWLLNETWVQTYLSSLQKEKARLDVRNRVINFLTQGVESLANLVTASKFVSDADRREELIRLFLEALELRPEGESEHQAKDRLNTLSSVERARVIDESKKAKERAVEVLRALKKKAADESADKWGRD